GVGTASERLRSNTCPAPSNSTSMVSPGGVMSQDGPANREWCVVEQAGASEARRQPAPQCGQTYALLDRSEQVSQDGQRRIARRQREHGARSESNIAAGQKSAVCFPADDACVCSVAAQIVQGGNDVWRSDLGLLERNSAVGHALLDGVIGANGDRGGIRAQVLGDHD